jgi:hypothetical protein
MKNLEFKQWDIVIHKGVTVQAIEIVGSSVMVQDIHTREEATIVALIDRVANRNEIKWFCENTEHIRFTNPKQTVR